MLFCCTFVGVGVCILSCNIGRLNSRSSCFYVLRSWITGVSQRDFLRIKNRKRKCCSSLSDYHTLQCWASFPPNTLRIKDQKVYIARSMTYQSLALLLEGNRKGICSIINFHVFLQVWFSFMYFTEYFHWSNKCGKF